MTFFQDRQDAGKRLALQLLQYKQAPETLVLGLPRGGVVVAFEVALALQLPLDIICPRKIGAPMNPEYAIGAVTETGDGVWNEQEIKSIASAYLKQAIQKGVLEAKERTALLRNKRLPLEVKDKTILLIDDGLATGLTMKAAIQSLRALHAHQIIVAVPVAPADTLQEIRMIADQVVCLYCPENFYAVGQFYQEFGPTSLENCLMLLEENSKLDRK